MFGDRGGGRDYGGEENTVDMFVPQQDCGRIIGRGGMKIRELQEHSGCKIKVNRDDEGDGTRRVELTGTDEAIDTAKAMITETLKEDSRGGGGYRGGMGGGGGGFGGGRDSSKEVMQIDSNFVGRIIGKGGSRVRELQDETGCRINVSRDGNGSYTDVELIGSRRQIQDARDAIDQITSQVY